MQHFILFQNSIRNFSIFVNQESFRQSVPKSHLDRAFNLTLGLHRINHLTQIMRSDKQ